jgi:hypothetical protein
MRYMHLLGKIRLFPGLYGEWRLVPRGWRANWLA